MKEVVDIAKALGDESRMRILLCLKDSNLCLCHVVEILGLSSATVSKHMSQLESAGLVVSRPEGKWKYFRWAGAEASVCVAQALEWVSRHAGACAVRRDDEARRAVVLSRSQAPCPVEARHRVLFLCTGNSCRSQMAEGLLRALAGDRFEVYSAGLDPQPVAELAIRVMREIGIDISGQHPKSVLDFMGKVHVGTLITVCGQAESLCPVFPGVSMRLHWPVPDPAATRGGEAVRHEAFRAARDDLLFKISSWLLDQGVKARPVPQFQPRLTRGRHGVSTKGGLL